MLLSGVRIIEAPPGDASRIALSRGTCGVSSTIDGGGDYLQDAIVPRRPWLPLTESDAASLVGGEAAPGEWITVVKVPDRILAPFWGIREAGANGQSDDKIHEITRSRQYAFGLNQLLEDLERQGGRPRHAGAGVNTRPPRLATCTVNSTTNRRVGLHVDTFYAREIDQRSTSPNRICLNLGDENRFFLFLNLPLSTMRRLLENVDARDRRLGDAGKGLASAFFETFPDYPIVRLKIAPGEAYLAPTENIIHDGSTEDKRQIDITLTILGHFDSSIYSDHARQAS